MAVGTRTPRPCSALGKKSLPYAAFKFLATWFTAWSGLPGGICAPALAIGGALGNDVSALAGYGHAPMLIALGVAGFLAAATQAPLTSFTMVMEMVDGYGMVPSLMACTLIATVTFKLITVPHFSALAELQLTQLRSGIVDAPPVPPLRESGNG